MTRSKNRIYHLDNNSAPDLRTGISEINTTTSRRNSQIKDHWMHACKLAENEKEDITSENLNASNVKKANTHKRNISFGGKEEIMPRYYSSSSSSSDLARNTSDEAQKGSDDEDNNLKLDERMIKRSSSINSVKSRLSDISSNIADSVTNSVDKLKKVASTDSLIKLMPKETVEEKLQHIRKKLADSTKRMVRYKNYIEEVNKTKESSMDKISKEFEHLEEKRRNIIQDLQDKYIYYTPEKFKREIHDNIDKIGFQVGGAKRSLYDNYITHGSLVEDTIKDLQSKAKNEALRSSQIKVGFPGINTEDVKLIRTIDREYRYLKLLKEELSWKFEEDDINNRVESYQLFLEKVSKEITILREREQKYQNARIKEIVDLIPIKRK